MVRTPLILLAALVLVPSAFARTTRPTLTISASSSRVLYGHTVTLRGTLRQGLAAGRAVKIEAWRYGRSAPRRIAVVKTSIDGGWTLHVRPSLRTSYQAASATLTSRPVVVGVAPAVTVRLLSNGRLRVKVASARSFDGRLIELQRRGADGSWLTVGRKRLSSASIAVLTPTGPTSTIRIAMSVNQAGAGYLGAASHAFVYRPEMLTLKPSAFKVLFGHRVTLDGRLVNGTSGEHVTILARRYGRSAPVRLAAVTTGPAGRFSVRVRPAILTTYEARLGAALTSAPIAIGVRPTMSVHEHKGGTLTAHVSAAAAFRGRLVELQRLRRGATWQTVARQVLKPNSTATFNLALPQTTVRVAMSVNQAGAGYLGTASHPLLYRAA